MSPVYLGGGGMKRNDCCDELLSENAELHARLGECVGCNYNDGPDECCPQHGRTVTEWIDIASERIGAANDLRTERDAALAKLERVRRIAEADRLGLLTYGITRDAIFAALADRGDQ